MIAVVLKDDGARPPAPAPSRAWNALKTWLSRRLAGILGAGSALPAGRRADDSARWRLQSTRPANHGDDAKPEYA